MSIRVGILCLGISIAVCVGAGQKPLAAGESPAFQVFDNMFFPGRPDTSADGIVRSNIVYEGAITPHGTGEGVMPSRAAFEALVRANSKNPGPFVIDVELLPLRGPDARQHEQYLATLADWARAAVPGKQVGFYGTGTLTKVAKVDLPLARELATHVDAFFPPMYTFDDDRKKWEERAKQEAAEDRALAPGKPVYFYLWPQYHDGTPKQFQWLGSSYWTFELQTSRKYADGIVIWGTSKYPWDDTTGWWAATQAFMQTLRASPSSSY